MMHEHHLPVRRTARFHTLGDPRRPLREIWFVLHGYGQLAARFLRHFEPIDDGTRLVVAPEALSRFYVESPGASHAQSPVGASWMTREDRLSEIDDYIEYLDALRAQVLRDVSDPTTRTVVLGFSQGAATACRWVVRSVQRTHRLIVWGSPMAHDLDVAAAAGILRELDLVVVSGDEDPLVAETVLADQAERLARHAVVPRAVRYAGGHRIDPDALRAIAAG